MLKQCPRGMSESVRKRVRKCNRNQGRQSLSIITNHYHSLPIITIHYHSLPFITMTMGQWDNGSAKPRECASEGLRKRGTAQPRDNGTAKPRDCESEGQWDCETEGLSSASKRGRDWVKNLFFSVGSLNASPRVSYASHR